MNKSEAARWVNEAWQGQVKIHVKVGLLLIAAKADLGPSEFARMVRENLPFTMRTANKLMAIAEHPIISAAADIPADDEEFNRLLAEVLAEQARGKDEKQ